MYFLKTKGTKQIPDFIQIRDEDMTLKAHFNFERLKNNIQNINFQTDTEIIIEELEKLDFGILLEIK